MAWYTKGTISISGTTVTGTGTNWTDNKMGIGPGQALLVPGSGTVKMYEILRVDSATKITLTSSAGTVAAGSAYAIMSFYTDSVPDFARRLAAQLNYYQSQMDGWQSIMTGTGNITIEAPDGTGVTISSFKKLTDDMASKVNRSELGNSATRDVNDRLPGAVTYLNAAKVMPQCYNDFRGITGYDLTTEYPLGITAGIQYAGNAWGGGSTYVSMINLRGWHDQSGGGYVCAQMAFTGGGMKYRIASGTVAGIANIGYTSAYTVYSTQNTTKASDGTLKAASPVCRIVTSHDVTERADVDEIGYAWCGAGTANEEAAGIVIMRQDVGVYVITGAAGLAEDGWRLLPPRDPDGSGDLGIVEAEENDDGITVRLYKRRWQMTDDGDIEPIKGALIDVPANSWIDVRLRMPERSEMQD